MLLKKQGFPQENELVLCTVTAINPHSAFCKLDEYEMKSGMIHISEIASGRIKNIKEYVQENKKIVCKVLQIHLDKGHIDLSLRRVNETQTRNKLNEIKQEQLAEKIIEQCARLEGAKPEVFMKKVWDKVSQKYATLFSAFEDVLAEKLKLDTVLDKSTAKALTDAVKARIKPPEVKISGTLKLTSYSTSGLEDIKEILALAKKEGVEVRYLGAGAFHLEVKAKSYKDAEKVLKTALELMEKTSKKKSIEFIWERKEAA